MPIGYPRIIESKSAVIRPSFHTYLRCIAGKRICFVYICSIISFIEQSLYAPIFQLTSPCFIMPFINPTHSPCSTAASALRHSPVIHGFLYVKFTISVVHYLVGFYVCVYLTSAGKINRLVLKSTIFAPCVHFREIVSRHALIHYQLLFLYIRAAVCALGKFDAFGSTFLK